jgi:hypothetical protein
VGAIHLCYLKQLIFKNTFEGTGPLIQWLKKIMSKKDNAWYSYSGQFIEHAGAEVLPNMFEHGNM